ncbi:Smr/MutS family protein [Candidatus Nitrotoga fabula]|uniref:Smr protein/MutS2 n=1 Tax=Candidatus Nitrotoga fabula TaxID=2182327 RepID=A0A916BAM1_9PROT|nr:Smr/MutS family protein [Candidatus Nitrotoga fabula]CAE6688125.1 Smr protein/MutS2 [Candidatus Nitrotoga fabula]
MAEKKGATSPDSDLLFQQAMEGVTPLPSLNRVAAIKPVHQAPARNNPQVTRSLIPDNLSDSFAEEEVAPTEFLRSGMPKMILRKLRRGHWQIQDILDLHGYNKDAARKRLLEFLYDAVGRKLRFVCVIHGKGWQMNGREGLLKSHVRHWLPQHPDVLAFSEAPRNAGGSGAVWVLLRTGDKTRKVSG